MHGKFARPAEVIPKERLAQRLRYCRIMPMKRRNAPAWTPGQGETAPWTARFDGFVKHRNPKKHNLYSNLSCVALARREHLCRAGKFPVRRLSSRIIEKYQAIHIYCAASGATYEYALDIFAALFVRVTASL